MIALNVQKDGSITDVTVGTPTNVASFNDSALQAILASSPTQPLPPEYPEAQAFFTVTFYYNKSPPSHRNGQLALGEPSPVAPLAFEKSATSLVATTALDVEQRLGQPAHVDGHRWTYAAERRALWVYCDAAQVVIDVKPRGSDLTIFKK